MAAVDPRVVSLCRPVLMLLGSVVHAPVPPYRNASCCSQRPGVAQLRSQKSKIPQFAFSVLIGGVKGWLDWGRVLGRPMFAAGMR